MDKDKNNQPKQEPHDFRPKTISIKTYRPDPDVVNKALWGEEGKPKLGVTPPK